MRIGVVLEHSGKAPLWVTKLLYLLIAEPAIKLDVVYRLDGTPASPKPEPAAFFRLMRRGSERYAAPLAIVPMVVRPACCFIDVEWDETAGRFTEESRAIIRARQLDAIVWLDAIPQAGDCGELARLGVWSFALGDPSKPVSDPPYWREIAEREPVSVIALLRHPERLEEAQVIAMHAAPTVHAWRGVLDALICGSRWAGSLPAPVKRSQPSFPGPTNAASTRFVAQRLKHSLSVRSRPKDKRQGQWSIAIRPKQTTAAGDKWNAAGFQFIRQPGGSQYADPFVLEQGGRNFLFFEDVPAGSSRGRISALELEADCGYGDPFVVLETPYHLSYPVVFKHEGEIYLLPESAENRALSLYRARRFPNEWEHCANLIEDMPVVDTTPFLYNSVWYFFATSKAPGIETFLLYAHDLQGCWHYHPANPICSDAQRARGAGAIFERHGRWIRPAQDSTGRYGSAIVFNEIRRLSTTEYEERPVETILPDWHKGLKGTHTYNANDRFETIDGLRFDAALFNA